MLALKVVVRFAIVASVAVLLTPIGAAADPNASQAAYQLVDERLSIESLPEDDGRVYRPHKWLSHTVRNLDLDLANPDLALGFSFDIRDRRAHFKLGGASNEALGLGIDTDVKFAKGRATLHTTLNLGIAGGRYSFQLPEVSLVPKSHKGQRYIEYQVPVVRGNIDDVLQGLSDPAALFDRLRFF